MDTSTRKFYVHYEEADFTTKIVWDDPNSTVEPVIKKFTEDYNEKHGETRMLDPRRIQLKQGDSKKLLKPTDKVSLIQEGDDIYASDFMPLDVPFACGRNGCNKTFTEAENTDSSCQFHSSSALFHEGLKGWNCCTKRVVDFDEMMAIPGCSLGRHLPKDPVAKAKPKVISTGGGTIEKEEFGAKTAAPVRKPEPKREAPKPVVPVPEVPDPIDAVIAPGTSCTHGACTSTFKDDSSRTEICVYHPGVPQFHEGSKGWTCCKKRVLDFTEFLNLSGCTTGVHKFIKPPEPLKVRYEFYQNASFVIVTFFSKNCKRDKESSCVTFESQQMHVKLTLATGEVYQESIPLSKAIDPAASRFEVMGTKVEVKLKKAQSEDWDPFNLTGQ